MPMLIGLTGVAGSGKDAVAEHLYRKHGFTVTSFASPLKKAAQVIFGLTDSEMRDRTLKEAINPYWGLSPRQIMQQLGTEAMKGTFGKDVWIKSWKRYYALLGTTDHIVVSDLRFDEEADAIRDLGGKIIHITRDNNPFALTGIAASHASEAGVMKVEGDLWVGNNGSLADLWNAADSLVSLGMGA